MPQLTTDCKKSTRHFHSTYVTYTSQTTALLTALSTALSVVLCTALSLKYNEP